MSTTSLERTKWHECVVDLLGRSDAIADRDADGRAVYYLFGWSGALQYIDSRGKFTDAEAGLGSVRMDGFSLFTRAQLEDQQIIVAEIRTPNAPVHTVYARITSIERAAKLGKSFDCVIIDRPEFIDDRAVRVSISQCFD